MATTAVTPQELLAETAMLLPERDTLLTFNINVTPVIGVNMAFAINAATIGGSATAIALQEIGIQL